MGHPSWASIIPQYPSGLPLSQPLPHQFLQLPQTFDDCHTSEVEHRCVLRVCPEVPHHDRKPRPVTVNQLVYHPRFKNPDLSSIEGFGCTAAHFQPQLADQLHARFLAMNKVSEGYGLSELTMAVAMKPSP
ncbi:hypothetical protein BDR05DRAFT_968906 [Suillus weaverae]|nr:hypothetical protein BDR05DRAFT_968906 [Suillus weaverae]